MLSVDLLTYFGVFFPLFGNVYVVFEGVHFCVFGTVKFV